MIAELKEKLLFTDFEALSKDVTTRTEALNECRVWVRCCNDQDPYGGDSRPKRMHEHLSLRKEMRRSVVYGPVLVRRAG